MGRPIQTVYKSPHSSSSSSSSLPKPPRNPLILKPLMDSSLLSSSSSHLHLPKLIFQNPSRIPPPFRTTICCGLRRAGQRKPLWKSTVMSTEAIQAVQALKLAKSSPSREDSKARIAGVFSNRIERLIKADLVAVLAELQRQNECEIALQVFAFIRKEVSLQLDLSLYSDMILLFGKNKLIEMAEKTFSLLKKDGLQPNTRIYTEMIGAYLNVEMVDKSIYLYKMMKESGCHPDRLTLTILIRYLDKAGEEDLASTVRKDCEKYVDYPEKFLEEVDRRYPKRRSLKLV